MKTTSHKKMYALVLLLFAGLGCASDQNSQYDLSIASGDYVKAKILMAQLIDGLSHRDYNPTLPLRMAQSYYRMAYAHGKLAEYDSMIADLNSSVGHDRGFAEGQQQMIGHFATEEYNKAAAAYNARDYKASLGGLRRALLIIATEKGHEKCAVAVLQGIASLAVASGSMKEAQEICERAAALGNPIAKRMLAHIEEGQLPAPLEKLEPMEPVAVSLP